MRHHSNITPRRYAVNCLPNRNKSIVRFLLLIFIFAIATPALADYLGPDRTRTETTSTCKVILYSCQFVEAKNDYRYHKVQEWSCSNENKPWEAYPDQPQSQGCQEDNKGDKYWGREEVIQEATITYPPATISRTLQNCTLNSGWCITPPLLALSGSEPVSGYSILAIEGTRNGQSFACSGANCSVPLNEGNNSFSYWALSSWGDSSTMGTFNAKVDTQNPVLTASISGLLGSNNWYTNAELDASASDPSPGSGLAALEYRLDASSWVSFPGSGVLTLPDGKHSIDVRAVDIAGRITSSSKSFWLDTVAPDIVVNPSGTAGSNNWYTTDLNVTASASDNTSGIDIFEYSLNNVWTSYLTPLTLTDGVHSLSFWAQDIAGLATQVDHTYQVDTHPPQIAGNLSGIPGTNGWYISEVTLSATAADPSPGSGIEAFTYILNGDVETPYTDALTLSNGQHTVQFNVQDRAGLSYSTQQTIKVDTISPSLIIQTSLPNWIKDSVVLSGIAGDSGSGLLKVEISTDNGQTWQPVVGTTSWTYTWDTLNNPNGMNDVQVRAIDNAGLVTKHTLSAGVDYRAPKISLPDSWYQWDTVTLDIWDDDSGLSEARIEIRDPEERWPARIIRLGLGRFPLDFKWDRRFGDDTVAPLGTYDVSVVAFDNLGNVTRKSASIKILLGILPAGPTTTPLPASRPTGIPTITPNPTATPTAAPTQTAVVSIFGAIEPTAQATPIVETSPTPRVAPTQTNVLDWLQTIFEPNPQAAEGLTEIAESVPLAASQSSAPQSNVLWGAAAAGVIGAATAYALEEKRKREEEEARQAEEVRAKVDAKNEAIQASQEAKREALMLQNWLQGQAMLNAQIEEAKKQGATAAQISALKQVSATQGVGAAIDGAINLAQSLYTSTQNRNAAANIHTARKEALVEAELKAIDVEQAEWEDGYTAYMAKKAMQEWQAGEKEIYVSPPKKESWWEKSLAWIDNHQAEIALGVGVVVGIGAVVLTAGLALPALAVIAGAAVVASSTVAAGTIALNVHYDRAWNENLVRNIAIAATGAAVVSGAALLLQTVATGIGGYCAINPSVCARVEPLLNAFDVVEEVWLNTKLGYQTWIGSPNAAETALELHSERVDGGMPGNSLINELGGETLEAVAKYGNEALELVKKYGPEAVQIISKYGDEGIAILQKYGDDSIALFQQYGDDAIRVIALYKDESIGFIRRAEELGVDPTEILDNPPLPDQTLEGWLLNIDNPENPVNIPLKLNLSDEEITRLRIESIQNPESKLFSIGYGKDAKIPFDKMANHFGDDHKMSLLAMSEETWARFREAKAYGDFWEVNSDAIEWGMEERKIFVMNINYDLATNPSPSSTRRFTLAEVRLIEMPTNDYTLIRNGDYAFFVPNELLDTYQDFLPSALLKP